MIDKTVTYVEVSPTLSGRQSMTLEQANAINTHPSVILISQWLRAEAEAVRKAGKVIWWQA